LEGSALSPVVTENVVWKDTTGQHDKGNGTKGRG
jgi:hypothetical protein